jgi:molybdopterin synthase catalytic subunit
MDHPPTTPPLPADYYRQHAAGVRKLAIEATTLAVNEHLREVAQEYERLAESGSTAACHRTGDRRSCT